MIPSGYLHQVPLCGSGDFAAVDLTDDQLTFIRLRSHVGSLMRSPDVDKDLSALHVMLLQWSYIS